MTWRHTGDKLLVEQIVTGFTFTYYVIAFLMRRAFHYNKVSFSSTYEFALNLASIQTKDKAVLLAGPRWFISVLI